MPKKCQISLALCLFCLSRISRGRITSSYPKKNKRGLSAVNPFTERPMTSVINTETSQNKNDINEILNTESDNNYDNWNDLLKSQKGGNCQTKFSKVEYDENMLSK